MKMNNKLQFNSIQLYFIFQQNTNQQGIYVNEMTIWRNES